MSKLFDASQAQTSTASENGLREITQILEGIRTTDGAATEMAKHRLDSSRRVTLSRQHEAVLLSAEDSRECMAAMEAYRALRTRLVRLQNTKGIRSVAITSALHGDGKSLTSLNLAIAVSQMPDARVLLVDGDLRTRGLTSLVGNFPPPGLTEVLDSGEKFENAIVSTNLQNLHFAPAGLGSMEASELFAKPRWKEFVGWCAEGFKLMIVDCPPLLGLADTELISAACDGVLLVVRDRRTDRELLSDAVKQIDKSKALGVIYNAKQDTFKRYYGYGYDAYYGRGKAKQA